MLFAHKNIEDALFVALRELNTGTLVQNLSEQPITKDTALYTTTINHIQRIIYYTYTSLSF